MGRSQGPGVRPAANGVRSPPPFLTSYTGLVSKKRGRPVWLPLFSIVQPFILTGKPCRAGAHAGRLASRRRRRVEKCFQIGQQSVIEMNTGEEGLGVRD